MPEISRRHFVTASFAGAANASLAAPPAKPNILIFLADDQGWGDVGYHGGQPATPNIDRLARQGVELDRFYATPICSPTRASLMTGRSPMRLGIAYNVVRPWTPYSLPLDEHIMPQTFRAVGYQTAIIGKWHLGHRAVKMLPHARGFDHFYGHVNGAIDYYTHDRDGGIDWQRNGKSVREEGYSTDLLAAEAMRFIERRDRDRPFFLYMPFNAPHGPLMAPPGDLVKKYEGIADKKRRTYVAMVDAMDTAMGRVLACLDGEGIARNTLVLYLSDNGGPLSGGASNLQLRGAKDTVFEGGIRVPAAMYWPAGLKGGRTITQMVTVLDMLPTLAAAAGVKPGNTKPLDGRNMWPHIVRGDVRPREDLFFTTGLALGSGDPLHLAVRRGEWKLVREVKSGQAQDFLFQIEQDPNETKDLSAKHPALVKELVAAIQKWQALHPRGGKESPDRMPAGWVAPKDWARAAELEQWPDGNASSALHQY